MYAYKTDQDNSLAFLGGAPVRCRPFPMHNTIGDEEKKAVTRVLDSGVLSKYLGCWHDDFMGGPEVRALEAEWADFFNVRHAIAVNSCTSGLFCAVGAIETEPGDEIIVPPYTMSATAVAPLIYNAIPVFADIDPMFFCIDPLDVEQKISPRTRAIIAVDLFGHPYNADTIAKLAEKYGISVIEDTAQAPGATYKGKFTGTLGDIGVYSLNYHKHIHCGEGGIVVTDDDNLADRIRLIRNHAESVVEAKGEVNLVNMVGFNFRMTEMEAAVARCQLRKLPELLKKRRDNCHYLATQLEQIPAITTAKTMDSCSHAFYVHACTYDERVSGITRDLFIEAVKSELAVFEGREAEGVKLSPGYVKPLYLQPIFQTKTAYGKNGFPFSNPWTKDTVRYDGGNCPVCEAMYYKKLFLHEMILPSMTKNDLDDVCDAFFKVWEYRHLLKEMV